jgi:hypothetical protein
LKPTAAIGLFRSYWQVRAEDAIKLAAFSVHAMTTWPFKNFFLPFLKRGHDQPVVKWEQRNMVIRETEIYVEFVLRLCRCSLESKTLIGFRAIEFDILT